MDFKTFNPDREQGNQLLVQISNSVCVVAMIAKGGSNVA